MNYHIREIEDKDNLEVERVIRSCLIEFHGDHEGTAWCDPYLNRFYQLYHQEGSCYWVIEDAKGHIVGGAGIGPLKEIDGLCELQKMYCLPEIRGTGLSHQLMETALNFASQYYQRCYIETLENMIAAQKFYEKYGFQRIDQPLLKTSHGACDVRYVKQFKKQ